MFRLLLIAAVDYITRMFSRARREASRAAALERRVEAMKQREEIEKRIARDTNPQGTLQNRWNRKNDV